MLVADLAVAPGHSWDLGLGIEPVSLQSLVADHMRLVPDFKVRTVRHGPSLKRLIDLDPVGDFHWLSDWLLLSREELNVIHLLRVSSVVCLVFPRL